MPQEKKEIEKRCTQCSKIMLTHYLDGFPNDGLGSRSHVEVQYCDLPRCQNYKILAMPI